MGGVDSQMTTGTTSWQLMRIGGAITQQQPSHCTAVMVVSMVSVSALHLLSLHSERLIAAVQASQLTTACIYMLHPLPHHTCRTGCYDLCSCDSSSDGCLCLVCQRWWKHTIHTLTALTGLQLTTPRLIHFFTTGCLACCLARG